MSVYWLIYKNVEFIDILFIKFGFIFIFLGIEKEIFKYLYRVCDYI